MMEIDEEVARVFSGAVKEAGERGLEYVTPELFLLKIADEPMFREAFEECGGDCGELKSKLEAYIREQVPASDGKKDPVPSADLNELLFYTELTTQNCGKRSIDLNHLIAAYYHLENSFALYYLMEQGIEKAELLLELIESGEKWEGEYEEYEVHEGGDNSEEWEEYYAREYELEKRREELMRGGGKRTEGKNDDGGEEDIPFGSTEKKREKWRDYVTCLNDSLSDVSPLIGREDELERTMQILCRREKNNPLHIGEPGVGKTAIAYGLARLLEEEKVPEALKGARIYSLDLGAMIAGTQYRGEFEKRLKSVLAGLEREEKPIVYLDEIHNIVGAGAVGEGSFDASNLLKPYLAAGRIRFIGATTHEEYKKHFEKSKSLVRRFQNIEISEPGEEETVKILEGLRKHYEKYHGVSYKKGVMEYAVHMSARYINERFLPDKAIDLIDEAGAYRKLHPLPQKKQTVGKEVIDEILSKTCRIPKKVVESGEIKKLAGLERRLSACVFGQGEAIKEVVNAIKFSRAGLSEAGKPLASFLFVGPTGVGKTEIARSLASELGIRLIRFDMSEYEEKHAVAKLIGAPAGYVGYEEGGLLTEAVRKNPHAVLLLDEIEKAHSDIYNILLQVMDYATLTDNQGRKADFRNIVLIMTSNAGASRLTKARLGFGDGAGADGRGSVIMDEVNRVFQPEFRNRLSRIVVFGGIDERTAREIAGKKLRELGVLLSERQVEFSFTRQAEALLTKKGVSREYGARELTRVIEREIKPLLADRLLFGSLKRGGFCRLDAKDGAFVLSDEAGAKEKREEHA